MKPFQIIFSTVCLLVLSCEAIAQLPSQQEPERQVVEGMVVDQGGDAVAAATVTLSSDTFRTTSHTDNEGRSRLDSIAQESMILESQPKVLQPSSNESLRPLTLPTNYVLC